jgi:hypothetical protein
MLNNPQTPHKLLKVFKPSSASRQLVCTKSILYDVNAPYTSSVHADLGNKLHSIGEEILLGTIEDVNDLYLLEDDDINKNVIRMLSEYNEYIFTLEDNDNEIMVERKVHLDSIYNFTVDKYGTIDCAIINSDTNTLHIVDLKTGRNDVSAKDNTQLYIYAYSLLQEIKDSHNIETINLHIFQNLYTYNINNFEISVEDLTDWIYKNVISKLNEIRFLELEFKVGSHCKYCPNLNNCNAINIEINNLLDSKDTLIPSIDKADILNKESAIINQINKYKEDLELELKDGKEVKGVKLVKGNKRKFITDSEMQMLEYEVEQKGLKVDDLYNFKPKTPNQIMELLTEKEIMIDLNQFITIHEPKINLALSTNRRKAIKI